MFTSSSGGALRHGAIREQDAHDRMRISAVAALDDLDNMRTL
jgi:hypothetical protein